MIGVRRQVNPSASSGGGWRWHAPIFARWNESVPRLSRQSFSRQRAQPRKSARTLRLCAKVQQPVAFWMLVVSEQSFDGGRITRERIEMLGTSFIPQHSDARVLEQVIYKWRNTRITLTPILTATYRALARDGRGVTRQDIEHDVHRLFRFNFTEWTHRRAD